MLESVKDYWDYYSTMKTANRKGHAEGRAEGHMDVARKLKSMGFSDEDIAHATGLTLDEVKQLH